MNPGNARIRMKPLSVGAPLVFLAAALFWSHPVLVRMAAAQKPAAASQKTSAGVPSFSFVFMTDIHIQPERRATEGVLQAIDAVNKLNPDFVITGGDNVMDASGQQYERADRLYRLFAETMKSLRMPCHCALGNHEFCRRDKNNKLLQPEQYKDMYKARLGKTYYAFEHKGWHFIVLDSIMFGKGENYYYGQIDPEQMTWLRQTLKSIGKKKAVAVAMHVLLLSIAYQVQEKGFTPRSVIKKKTARELVALFEEYNVRIVLQGHLHIYEDILYNGIHYVTGGAVCSAWWRGKHNGMEEGFVLVTVRGDEVSAKYIDFGWEVEAPKKKEGDGSQAPKSEKHAGALDFRPVAAAASARGAEACTVWR